MPGKELDACGTGVFGDSPVDKGVSLVAVRKSSAFGLGVCTKLLKI
jgi:hypothetical protein